jgi:hypothetical protein
MAGLCPLVKALPATRFRSPVEDISGCDGDLREIVTGTAASGVEVCGKTTCQPDFRDANHISIFKKPFET